MRIVVFVVICIDDEFVGFLQGVVLIIVVICNVEYCLVLVCVQGCWVDFDSGCLVVLVVVSQVVELIEDICDNCCVVVVFIWLSMYCLVQIKGEDVQVVLVGDDEFVLVVVYCDVMVVELVLIGVFEVCVCVLLVVVGELVVIIFLLLFVFVQIFGLDVGWVLEMVL